MHQGHDMRAIRTTKDEVHDITGWRRIVSAAATPQPSGAVVLSSDDEHGELHLLLLPAATTWLWGCCGRYNSPPASYVMDFICRRSDCSHVSVDTVSHLCFGIPLFLLPGGTTSRGRGRGRGGGRGGERGGGGGGGEGRGRGRGEGRRGR